jgi:hypothetical protein
MGLDMYVYRTKQDIPKVGNERPADSQVREDQCLVEGKFDWNKYERLKKKLNAEVFYWRKHPDLHGWFKTLWQDNGGKPKSDYFGDDFNGDDWVRIDEIYLDDLEEDMNVNMLPHTRGFFFGQSYHDDDERKNDLKFIKKARALLKKGWKLYYTSSW